MDDDASFLKATARLLAANGFQSRTYSSATDLLGQIGPKSRGCVVADLHMPGMSGLELQQALARLGIAMPFILITAHPDAQSASLAAQQGAQAFLEQLAPKEQLVEAVRLALDRDAARRARAKPSGNDPAPD